MTLPQPAKQHQWLQQLVGEWTFESEAMGSPEAPGFKCTGTESVRSLGGLWIIGEGQSEMPGGGAAHMVLTVGFNPDTGRFIGTWIGSMMTTLFNYDGHMDDTGKKLFLECDGPNCMDPSAGMCRYRETIEILSPDRRTFSSSMQNPDGTWTKIMTSTYQRK